MSRKLLNTRSVLQLVKGERKLNVGIEVQWTLGEWWHYHQMKLPLNETSDHNQRKAGRSDCQIDSGGLNEIFQFAH